MSARWERHLQRWTREGLIDPSTAGLIRAYESRQDKSLGLRWPVRLAIGLGGLLLGTGVLLFVAAHWDKVSPAGRFGLVLALVALFHVAGAGLAERFPVLSITFHAVGTVCLGAGIFLAGQIFHLQEHWPGGVMLWALGAWVSWALLRDKPQAVLVAVLMPIWLGGEWIEASDGQADSALILGEGILSLAITYLTALFPEKETPERKALLWVGKLSLIPAIAFVIFANFLIRTNDSLPNSYRLFGWGMALGLPLLLAWWLRRNAAWMNVIAAFWIVLLGTMSLRRSENELELYGVCALGSIGLIAWGLKEARKERINLGIAGFALTVLAFYFSNVMDKLGRSASLVGLGALFLLGGWLLEKTRRRLVARLEEKR